MITGEDIERMKEEDAKGKKLVVIDTMQFFEIEVPDGMTAEDYVDSEECRKECAARILNQTTDLSIDRVLTNYNAQTGEWT